ncbi:TerD family protein [Oscillatoria sp. FACHB-1406]|uniref:TerD family protein n=1 Tax=Oscillatoria sp. FACHB-1406 TaxID=2692846 RepID=UPI001689FCDF|nr:TerD family protein [Oscillatoria sp. FACHB-1406]MBD2579247.1 TerD family protein [Oscillatoria sp. FACHB-1406]
MAINLSKGSTISLEKVLPNLDAAFAGLGWDVGSDGASFDLDVSVMMLGSNGHLVSDKHFVFYNQKRSPESSPALELTGDNRTGEGDGDDEAIIMDLRKVDPAVEEILVCITIHEATARGQNFGMVSEAYVRLVNIATREEVLRYDLDAQFSNETAVVMAKFKRAGSSWSMTAVGEGYSGGLEGLVERYQ